MYTTTIEARLANDADGRYAATLARELRHLRTGLDTALAQPQSPAERERLLRLLEACNAAQRTVRRLRARAARGAAAPAGGGERDLRAIASFL